MAVSITVRPMVYVSIEFDGLLGRSLVSVALSKSFNFGVLLESIGMVLFSFLLGCFNT